MSEPLDSFDCKILTILQEDCQLKAEQIAEQVGLSTSAVQRRIKRLRQDKIITAEIAVLDRKAAGKLMTFVVGLEIERENYTALARFRAWAGKQLEIQQAYYVTGSVDVILIIVAEDVEAFDAVSARVMAHNPQVRRMTTNVVLSILKLGLSVPVETAR
ncbi:Lrp/AsnC family transcriptional regulator [Acidisoma cellulosilytica]|uniref:Lrp/AsnC family transcriptional regulator n=1 Tax=Acidisoma cellulosilyticum TaxID=2802395 RepID=A0A964E519_9PROT|nr:Lrp/AsnC family transcriptional regulator [Acidisoma cellulosilyticum]MCB8881538.1 Lrp/AsnC family transcriptional regulator [Acidisoma cellulosilyticum]